MKKGQDGGRADDDSQGCGTGRRKEREWKSGLSSWGGALTVAMEKKDPSAGVPGTTLSFATTAVTGTSSLTMKRWWFCPSLKYSCVFFFFFFFFLSRRCQRRCDMEGEERLNAQ